VDPGVIEFNDEIQGLYQQDPAKAVGDFVVQRRDRVFAYQLAVVVDDAAQGVTKIVRGSDLLDNTPRQIRLQTLLGLATPAYAHVAVLVEADGSKLAKSRRSLRADAVAAVATVVEILRLLGQEPPPELAEASLPSCWQWAMAHWRLGRVPQQASLSAALLAEP
jgi:glutamyl-Q tRNA(Asp) synthetase